MSVYFLFFVCVCERSEREEEANTLRPAVYSMSEKSRREIMLLLCLWDVPGEDPRKIFLYLNFKQRRHCNHGSQMKQQDICDR